MAAFWVKFINVSEVLAASVVRAVVSNHHDDGSSKDL
jgi:hypothetical protein